MLKARHILLGALWIAGCDSQAETPLSAPAPFDGSAICQKAGSDQTISASITALLNSSPGTHSEDQLADALLKKAAIEIANSTGSFKQCQEVLSEGSEMFRSVLNGQQNTLSNLGGFKKARDKSLRSIQLEITRLWREDQSARGAYMGLSTKDITGPAFWAQRLATAHATRIDARSKSYIESLLQDYDWIDRKRFGKVVSDHAWILVQHADDHPEFQADVLARMQKYLKSGGVDKSNYAYLWDRLAVNTGQKQKYGTQPIWECSGDGNLTLAPVEDPDNLDQRRKSMGLGPVEKALEKMAMGVCQ